MTPIDFGRLQVALASARGWLELAVMLLCIGVAWAIDRRLDKARERRALHLRLPGGFVRIAFPLLALALTYIASFAWRRYAGPPFFLAIATPILIALAIIRMIAYGLRRLFPKQAWLPASELAAKQAAADAVEVRDAVGNVLADGDQVTLIKDLTVKGAGRTLKQGTLIKSIRLTGDPQEIDCKYEGIKGLVLRAEFVRKR